MAARGSLERELSIATALLEDTKAIRNESTEDLAALDELTLKETETKQALSDVEAKIEASIEAKQLQRQRLLDEQSRIRRLATMAELALNELGDVCPVCQQKFDHAHTRKHLEALIDAVPDSANTEGPRDESLDFLLGRRSQVAAELAALQARIRAVESGHNETERRRAVYSARVADFGIAEDDIETVLPSIIRSRVDRIGRLNQLLQDGEALSLSIVRLGELERRVELERERAALQPRMLAVAHEIRQLESTHRLAGKIIDGLRSASLDVTRLQIKQIEPMFQRIYSRIDPHPTFQYTHLETRLERGRGQLLTSIADPHHGEESYEALHILSSSQLNSFAVSLFLAINLSLPSLRLGLVMLDDPLQSLDSINLLGLVDVLRRFRQHRQIVVSTHEDRLLGLLQRKLRPVTPHERMLTHYFGDWTREGPEVRSVETTFDEGQARVLAA